jgi:hypothetical protein
MNVRIVISASGTHYAIAPVGEGSSPLREVGIWLSLKKYPLPVPPEWRKPLFNFAAVIRGRDYYRLATVIPQRSYQNEIIAADDERANDYRDAAWWTPGLEEAWAECEGLKLAVEHATSQPEGQPMQQTGKKGKRA